MKKVKKFVDMSMREVYDKHNNPKENDFDRNQQGNDESAERFWLV